MLTQKEYPIQDKHALLRALPPKAPSLIKAVKHAQSGCIRCCVKHGKSFPAEGVLT